MSGECYPAKNLHLDINTPKKDNKILEATTDSNKHETANDQLIKYDAVVSSTVSKCSQLRSQIERIKQFYNEQRGGATTIKRKTVGSCIESFGNKNSGPIKAIKTIRQNSQAIGTDRTGAALGTINNILAGITKPIQISNISRRDADKSVDSKAEIQHQEQVHGVEQVKINSKSKHSVSMRSKTSFPARKSKSKAATIISSTNFKKAKKATVKILPDKRYRKASDHQITKVVVPPVISKRSKKILIRQHLNHRKAPKEIFTPKSNLTPRTNDLVEIYHNNAVKESKSSESDMTKKKSIKVDPVPRTTADLIPPLSIDDNETKIEESRGTISCIYKNYTLPTISSRMKQAAKYYMNSFNIKTIPFCLSTSTSPSHNIGINVQQVMSMVKSKQPVGRLSPTLAYNIGLAAGRREDNLIPFLVSSMTSNKFYTQCPLTKSNVNYQQLQEVAKTIPQETIEEAEENEDANSPETQSIIITGPSGDVKVKNKKQTVWAANSDEKKCTCVVQKGLAFQQIVNKFNGVTSKDKVHNSQSIVPTKRNERKTGYVGQGEERIKPTAGFLPLRNNEKKLKEVLGKLHNEFEKMTKTYDELVKKSEGGTSDPNIAKRLETLDQELSSKEEEIIMVMSLYKEVLALKQQVQTLKERTSKENIFFKNHPSKFNGINKVTTAGLLNQLLQRVHHFQSHYKKP